MEFSYKNMPVMSPITIPTKKNNIIFAIFLWVWTSRKWKIEKDWFFTIDGIDYVIKKGFIFDGASVPKILRSWLSPMGILLIPGLIHDFAYKYEKLQFSNGTLSDTGSRAYFDNMFREVAINVNAFLILNYLAYLGLVLAGWIPWSGHRKREITIEG